MNQDYIDAALEAAHTASPEQEYIAELQNLVDPAVQIVSVHIATEDDELRSSTITTFCNEGDLIVTLKTHSPDESPETWEENWGDPQQPDPYYGY